MDVIGDIEHLIEVVVGRDIQSSVTLTVTHDEFIFQPSDINLVDGTNKWKTMQAAQWDRETQLKKGFDSNPVNHNIRVFFLCSPNQKLNLFWVGLIKRTQRIDCNRCITLKWQLGKNKAVAKLTENTNNPRRCLKNKEKNGSRINAKSIDKRDEVMTKIIPHEPPMEHHSRP